MKRMAVLVGVLLMAALTASISWSADQTQSSAASPSVQADQQVSDQQVSPSTDGTQTGRGGRGSFENRCKTRFQSLDANKDGMLSEEEFCKRTPRMTCQDRFQQMDSNKDGTLSKEEFMNFSQGRPRAEDVFKAKDANGDGSLTQDEFCARRGPRPAQNKQSQ